MTHSRSELEALTAKALRPIAADLRIVGASRMKKDEIISAIIAAETTDLAKDRLDVADFDEEAVYAQADAPRIEKRSHWAMSFPLARGGDGYVMQGHADYCDAYGHATEKRTDRNGVTTTSSHCPRCGYVEPKLSPEFLKQQAENEAAYAAIPEQWAGIAAKAEDDNVREYPLLKAGMTGLDGERLTDDQHRDMHHQAEGTCVFDQCPVAPKAVTPPVFSRMTRHGIERVVIEDVRAGRVHYRHVSRLTGRTSSVYTMREATFSRQYSPVSQ